MLEEHQKKGRLGGGQLSATSPSQNSVLSCKPFFAVCVEKAQTKQLREGGREIAKQQRALSPKLQAWIML